MRVERALRATRMPLTTRVFLSALPILPVGCRPAQPADAPEISWQVATPESQGLSTAALDRQRDSIANRDAAAFVVVRNGMIVYEWYEPGFSATQLHYPG